MEMVLEIMQIQMMMMMVLDEDDAFPFDDTETADFDEMVLVIMQILDDNDGVLDVDDAFPFDENGTSTNQVINPTISNDDISGGTEDPNRIFI